MRDSIKLGHWARFTEDGKAAWFGPAWVEGAEFVEGVDADTLITHRRVDGAWIPREPEPVAEPTPEEIAAMAEADWQAALATREAQIDAAILASPAYRQFLRGEMTLTAYRDAASAIAEGFPMPERPA